MSDVRRERPECNSEGCPPPMFLPIQSLFDPHGSYESGMESIQDIFTCLYTVSPVAVLSNLLTDKQMRWCQLG